MEENSGNLRILYAIRKAFFVSVNDVSYFKSQEVVSIGY